MTHASDDNRLNPSASQPALTLGELDQVTGGTGSQSTNAGAGRITFTPLLITKKTDAVSFARD